MLSGGGLDCGVLRQRDHQPCLLVPADQTIRPPFCKAHVQATLSRISLQRGSMSCADADCRTGGAHRQTTVTPIENVFMGLPDRSHHSNAAIMRGWAASSSTKWTCFRSWIKSDKTLPRFPPDQPSRPKTAVPGPHREEIADRLAAVADHRAVHAETTSAIVRCFR